MEIFGYAREGRSGQNLKTQIHKLMDSGINIRKIYKERRSSLDGERPELAECLQKLSQGDVLVVTKIDRLAKNILHLNQIKTSLESKNCDLIAIDQGIDTSIDSKFGFFNLISVFSEFDMDIRVERQIEGIIKAKNNGVKFGRKPIETNIIKKILNLVDEGESVGQVSLKFGVGRSTIYRLLKKSKV